MCDYRTLPTNTLRRIAEIGGKLEKAKKTFAALQAELGSAYLRQLKARIGALDEEFIIAVENQNLSETNA